MRPTWTKLTTRCIGAPMLTYFPVSSSYVKALAWDEETEIFGVIFHNGHEYHYSHVPEWIAKEVMGAKSVGTSFDRLIKRGGYAYKVVRS
jgi:KTSC domain